MRWFFKSISFLSDGMVRGAFQTNKYEECRQFYIVENINV